MTDREKLDALLVALGAGVAVVTRERGWWYVTACGTSYAARTEGVAVERALAAVTEHAEAMARRWREAADMQQHSADVARLDAERCEAAWSRLRAALEVTRG